MFLKLLTLIVAWIAAIYGIWSDEKTLHKKKLIASIIASVALIVSGVIVFTDRAQEQLKDRIHEKQIYALTPVQTIRVSWEFENVPNDILWSFSVSDQKDQNFWRHFDWTDTPDMIVTKAMRVEFLVQPLINAIATGNKKYPYEGRMNFADHVGVHEPVPYIHAYHFLFPMNISMNKKIVLGRLSSDSEKESFEKYHEVIPYPAPKYSYTANARKTGTGFVLEFANVFPPGADSDVTVPSLEGFNIIIADNATRLSSAVDYFVPESQENMLMNMELDRVEKSTWRENSKLTLVINGVKEKPLEFDVTFAGSYIHAPRYTHEDDPHAEYIFTVYHCEFTPGNITGRITGRP